MNKENHKDALIITQDAMAKVKNLREGLTRELAEITATIDKIAPGKITMDYVRLGSVQWAINSADERIELLDHILEALWSNCSVVHIEMDSE